MKARLQKKKGKQYVAAYFDSKNPKVNRPGWKGKWNGLAIGVAWLMPRKKHT